MFLFIFFHALRFSFLVTFLFLIGSIIESSEIPPVGWGIGAFCFVCWMWCNRALGYTLLGRRVDDSDRSYFFLSISPFSYSKSDPDRLAIRFLWSLAFLILSFTIFCLPFSIFLSFLIYHDRPFSAYDLLLLFFSFFIGGFSYYRLQHIRKKRRANNLSMLPFLPIIVVLILVFSLLIFGFLVGVAVSNLGNF